MSAHLDLSDYEVIPPQAVAATKVLMDMRTRLGNPKDPFCPSGEKLMNIIIAVWEDSYPKQMKQWYKDRQDYKSGEMDIGTQVRHRTGRSLASYPTPIYNMIRNLFPGFDPATPRETAIKMVRKWPMFRMANKV